MFEVGVLRTLGLFGRKVGEIIRGWEISLNEHDSVYFLPYIMRVIKLRIFMYEMPIARMETSEMSIKY